MLLLSCLSSKILLTDQGIAPNASDVQLEVLLLCIQESASAVGVYLNTRQYLSSNYCRAYGADYSGDSIVTLDTATLMFYKKIIF